jgi:hypothetical protein
MKKTIFVLILASLIMGCNKKQVDENNSATSNYSVDANEAILESAVTSISGMADDQSGASYAQNSQNYLNKIDIFKRIFAQEALASNCNRAVFATCSSGVKSEAYTGCVPTNTSRSLTGQVQLNYSQSNCSLSSDGDQVVRTYSLNLTGPRGGVVNISSQSAQDYSGLSYGGGGKLTKTSSGHEIEILGKHKTFTRNNNTYYSVSVRTLNPLVLTGGLTRSSRVLSSGTIEVNHNLAKYTMTMTPNNVAWSNSCCHPVSGSFSVNYSGSKTGSATVTFNGCGTANLNQGGQDTQLTMNYCE